MRVRLTWWMVWCGLAGPVSASADDVAQVERAAKAPELMHGACSYSTAGLIARVLDEGQAYTFIGTLRASQHAARVATPFVVGPDDVRVLANGVLEGAVPIEGRVELVGKTLSWQGARYLVVTAVRGL